MFATLSEYERRTADGERLDFDAGRVVQIPESDSVLDGIMARLTGALIRQMPRPALAGNFLTYELAPGRIRHPRIGLVLKPRRRITGVRFQGAPDLAVEIVSSSENALDLHAKIQLYLENGAKAVWIIWPESRQIDIHQHNQPTRHLDETSVIEGEEPVPAFRLPVAALFA